MEFRGKALTTSPAIDIHERFKIPCRYKKTEDKFANDAQATLNQQFGRD